MRARENTGVAMVFILLTLLQPSSGNAAVQELVSSGVSSVVRGTPSAGDPTYYWASLPDCSHVPGDESQPVLFYRASLAVPSPRAIFGFNPARPLGTCNPYRLLSDIVTDETHLYFIDNQGPDGKNALRRLPRNASGTESPQFLAAIEPNLTSANLIIFNTVIFAILRADLFQVLVEYDKNTGALLSGDIDFGTELSNLQYDSRFLYWMSSGALRRDDTTNGEVVTVLPGPIQTYYTEGFDEFCSPDGCELLSRVLYGQDNALAEIETVSGNVIPIYTSFIPGARITDITRDATDYYFIERRSVSGGLDREDYFFRMSVSATEPDRIYGPINNGGPGFDSFTTDYTYLYFRDRVERKFVRLPNDETRIRVRDVAATGLEITQVLQNGANALRLIAGKRTIVRFYVRSNNPGEDIDGVTASLAGSNPQGGFLGRLEPVNSTGKLLKVRAAPQRQNLGHSFEFELPSWWTTGGSLSLAATVNPDRAIQENNMQNNGAVLGPVEFTPSPRLFVIYHNFSYDLGGTRYSPLAAEVAASRRFMRRLYPLGEPGEALESPGLHTITLEFVDNGLTPEVQRTASDCVTRHPKVADREMCASDYVHARMAALRMASSIAADTVYYGNIAQAPDPPGLSYFTRGYTTGLFSSGPSNDANYAAHEVGHACGRAHPAFGIACGHTLSDNDYPYALSLIENVSLNPATRYAGLDFEDKLPGVMTFVDAQSYYDTMSYCSPNWISDYTFNGIYDYLVSDTRPRAAPHKRGAVVPGDWLIVTGTLDPAKNAGGFVIVQRTSSISDATPPAAGGYTLELRNQAGGVLASYPFTANEVDDQPGHLVFHFVVPFIAGTAELRVVEDATARALATRAVSPNAPLISDVRVTGAPGTIDGVVAVTWNASDPDGDELQFDVLASRDGGQTYRPILLGLTPEAADLDTSMLGGGTNQLRIVASDGVLTAYAQSTAFTVPPRPPRISITSPVDGFRADWGQLLSLQVEVDDIQDEFIPNEQIYWSSSQIGPFASGRWVQVDQLPVGEHVLEVTATNSLGAAATADVMITIGDQLVPSGPTLSVAPQTIAWHVADGDATTQTTILSVENGGDGTLQFDVTSDAPWLLLDSAQGVSAATAPRIFTVTAAPPLVPAGTTTTATVTLQSLVDPNDRVVVPVQLSRGNVFDRTGGEPTAACIGDCTGDGRVTVDELLTGVNIALANLDLEACRAFDADGDAAVTVDELLIGVNVALNGCPGGSP